MILSKIWNFREWDIQGFWNFQGLTKIFKAVTRKSGTANLVSHLTREYTVINHSFNFLKHLPSPANPASVGPSPSPLNPADEAIYQEKVCTIIMYMAIVKNFQLFLHNLQLPFSTFFTRIYFIRVFRTSSVNWKTILYIKKSLHEKTIIFHLKTKIGS